MTPISERDLSSGLRADRESIRTTEPDVPFWSENMLFALHDPATDVALWLHLGTVPNDWTLWHDMNYAVLPDGDGVLSMWAHHRTDPALRPAGAAKAPASRSVRPAPCRSSSTACARRAAPRPPLNPLIGPASARPAHTPTM